MKATVFRMGDDGTLSMEQHTPLPALKPFNPTRELTRLTRNVVDLQLTIESIDDLQGLGLALEDLRDEYCTTIENGKLTPELNASYRTRFNEYLGTVSMEALEIEPDSENPNAEHATIDADALDEQIGSIWRAVFNGLTKLSTDSEQVFKRTVDMARSVSKDVQNVASELASYVDNDKYVDLAMPTFEAIDNLRDSEGVFDTEKITARFECLKAQTEWLVNTLVRDTVGFTKNLCSWLGTLSVDDDRQLELAYGAVRDITPPKAPDDWVKDEGNSSDEDIVTVAPAIFNGNHFEVVYPAEVPKDPTDYIGNVIIGTNINWRSYEVESAEEHETVKCPSPNTLRDVLQLAGEICNSIETFDSIKDSVLLAFRELTNAGSDFVKNVNPDQLSDSSMAKLAVSVQTTQAVATRLSEPFTSFLYDTLLVLTAVVELSKVAKSVYTEVQ